jgi:cytochrome c nitrite reductase small subunit
MPTDPSASSGLFGLSFAPILATAMVGVLVGLGLFTFNYAEGASYLSDNPETCVNCHIMRPEYDAWNRGSHKAVATCNSCHTRHDFVGKWYVKSRNGLNHSWKFTTGDFPEPIRITDFNAGVAQDNCVACHATMVSRIHQTGESREQMCTSCHGNVGHGR